VRGLQASSVRQGQIVTLQGRGFVLAAPLANAARYGPASSPALETLIAVRQLEPAAFNPLLEIRFVVPALPAGSQSMRLHNLATGFRTDPITLNLQAPGSASAGIWQGFLGQIAAVVEPLAGGRADLGDLASAWLATLAGASATTAAAMADNSGLVSAANLAAMQAISASGLTAAQRDLVARHALVLDAAASTLAGSAADAAFDLATLLMLQARGAPSLAAGVGTLQAGGGPACTGTASTGGVSFGSAVTTTGMGSAPPGSCTEGGAIGGGTATSGALHAGSLSPAAIATTSLRRGTYRPVAGAVVKVFRLDRVTPLAPFTAVTDATGSFRIPFVPPGEPFLVRAYDPRTGEVAEAQGVANAVNVSTPVSLYFAPGESWPGQPVASFVIRPMPEPRFAGTVYYEFDSSASTDDGTITTYVWSFGGFTVDVSGAPVFRRGYGRNGTYEVLLTVFDDRANAGGVSRRLVIDDLPYDYWARPPERVSERSDGGAADAGVEESVAVSADGRFVAFASRAANLHPDDANAESDVFVKDMATGRLELVSSGSAGVRSSGRIAMSADARYVAYDVATRANDVLGDFRIEVVDRQAGTVQTVRPEEGLSAVSLDALSGDGRAVLFVSTSSGIQTLQVLDLDTQELTRIGLERDGVTYAYVEGIALSEDGDVVLFSSVGGDLVPDPAGIFESNLYVYRRSDQSTLRVSAAADGTAGDRDSRAGDTGLTPDGRYVTFWSQSSTFPRAAENDDGNVRKDDLYVKDLATGALTLASTSATGATSDGWSIHGTISANGRYVAFGSNATNLVPEMDPDCVLVCTSGFSFVKDRQTGRVAMVTVGLDDTAPNHVSQIRPTISADGRYVVFESRADNLVRLGNNFRRNWFRAENPLWEP
jgi:Tol biopolymer transport system component